MGEVGETYTGLSGKSKDDFGHGSGKFITYMNVFSNPVASSNMTEAIEIDDRQNKVRFGDVLFTTSSETPNEVGMSSVWLENAENTYLNSFCFGYRPTAEYNSYYLAYMLRSSSMRKKITFLAQGISRYNISKNKMMDIEMPIPSIDEQRQIGEYFRNLDRLITLHQRKCKIRNLRCPKSTAITCEQRKLSNYLEVSNEKNANDVYGKQDVLSVSGDYGIVNQIEFQGRSFAGASVSNYGVVHTDDIVYTKSPLNANPYGIIKTNKGKTGIVSTLYAVYHPKKGTNSDFVQTYFEQHARMNNYMHPLVNKGAKNDMKVSAENALKGYVSFPNYEEQKAIAEAFSIIDCLITLHQRKPDCYQFKLDNERITKSTSLFSSS